MTRNVCTEAIFVDDEYVEFDQDINFIMWSTYVLPTDILRCPQEKTVITKGNGTILNSTTTKDLYKRASILGSGSHIVLPHATLDLSNGFNGTITAKSLELSTLV